MWKTTRFGLITSKVGFKVNKTPLVLSDRVAGVKWKNPQLQQKLHPDMMRFDILHTDARVIRVHDK